VREHEIEARQLEMWAEMLERAHDGHREVLTDAERCVIAGLRRQASRLRLEHEEAAA
jgi:hypothetical protein